MPLAQADVLIAKPQCPPCTMPENPEQRARRQIDTQLSAAGWAVQDIATLNLSASKGVAVREMQSQGGPADYILFVDGKALGIVEAKKEGTTLSAVAEQSARYSAAKKWIPPTLGRPTPFHLRIHRRRNQLPRPTQPRFPVAPRLRLPHPRAPARTRPAVRHAARPPSPVPRSRHRATS